MLKTLRIISLLSLFLAFCGVITIVHSSLKGDANIKAYLDEPGAACVLKKTNEGGDERRVSRLVTQARLFALRINPPKPEEPPELQGPEELITEIEPEPISTPGDIQITGPISESPKFTLLGTFLCQTNPTRSMVLLRQVSGKEAWFWQGEKIGRMRIDEIRNGSAIISQNSRNPKEYLVPPKSETKTLLKTGIN